MSYSAPPPPPGRPGWNGYPMGPYGGGSIPMGTNPLAVGSLVVGIASLVFGVVCCVGIITGLVAVGLGGAALVQVGATGQAGRGLAIAGVVTGLLAVVVYATLVLLVVAD